MDALGKVVLLKLLLYTHAGNRYIAIHKSVIRCLYEAGLNSGVQPNLVNTAFSVNLY